MLYRRPGYAREFANMIFYNKTIGEDTKQWIWHISMESSLQTAVNSLKTVEVADFRPYIPYINIPFVVFNGAHDEISRIQSAEWIAKNN